MRIFLTGASGCIGHYIAEALIQNTDYDLFLLVRNPAKLQVDYRYRPGVTLLPGDLSQVHQYRELLKTINQAILVATAWGGDDVFNVNVTQTLALLNLLDPSICQQAIYFSTASILNRKNQLLPEAGQLGIDYIRSKYQCYQQLADLAIAPHLTVLFPTLVFGGDDRKPQSHLSSGLPEVMRWMKLIRFLRAEGSFHFVHGQDIATVVQYLVNHPPAVGSIAERQMVLGGAAITVDQAIAQICAYLNIPIFFQVPLSEGLATLLIRLFRIQMDPWSYFAFLQYRHFTHQNPTNPTVLGLTTHCATLADVLQLSWVRPARQTNN
jgi:nucleoside-diphosphate-sugar epimerase